jgi:hypoxanthine phosphoribosyltransferase
LDVQIVSTTYIEVIYIVVPVPPSRVRAHQPVLGMAQAIAKDAHKIGGDKLRSRSVLIFDDLYRSGATLASVAQTLIDQGSPKEVYALTLTRSKKLR